MEKGAKDPKAKSPDTAWVPPLKEARLSQAKRGPFETK
jgi:hypothetical protein